jgi:RsmE family RNA methyltransferase
VNLILLEPGDMNRPGEATLTGPQAQHVIDVLKAVPGNAVRIGMLNGAFGSGTVTAITDRTVSLRCAFDLETHPRPRVDLILALPRPKVLRRLWAQLAALGVGQIILTNAEGVERPYFDTHVLDEAHYRPLLIEGLQQARDTRLPRVSIHRQFKVLVEDRLDALFSPAAGSVRVVADQPATEPIDAVARQGRARRLLVAVGPEGGWNEFERTLLRHHGFVAAGMGSRTLRSDTACIAVLALAHHALSAGD